MVMVGTFHLYSQRISICYQSYHHYYALCRTFNLIFVYIRWKTSKGEKRKKQKSTNVKTAKPRKASVFWDITCLRHQIQSSQSRFLIDIRQFSAVRLIHYVPWARDRVRRLLVQFTIEYSANKMFDSFPLITTGAVRDGNDSYVCIWPTFSIWFNFVIGFCRTLNKRRWHTSKNHEIASEKHHSE